MDFFEVIEKRRTVRDFEDFEIPEKVLEKIIGAALKAPTNDHMRDWHFIVITDRSVVARLLDLVPKSFSDREIENLFSAWNLTDGDQQDMYRNAVPKQHRMLMDASCVIVPLLKEKCRVLGAENISDLNGFASIWCAVENLFLAATAEGLGCSLRIPLGNEADHARKVLEFPSGYFMPCFIGLGKPSADAYVARQKKISVEDRIHMNRWS